MAMMMKKNSSYIFYLRLMVFSGFLFLHSCNQNQENEGYQPVWTTGEGGTIAEDDQESQTENGTDVQEDGSFSLPNIDLSNWKVTLPIGNNGRPIEVEPPEIIEYATNQTLRPFMYNDSIEGALVFYTYPGVTTPNSSRSRTELREQMVPGSNSTNWTFAQGGRLFGELAMDEISRGSNGDYHRTIIMQIHGRLTNGQRDLIGENDNNAPPMLKIYWQDGKVRVKTKVLKNPNTTGKDILYTSAWTDDEGHYFNEEVGFDKFTLEVKVEEGKMEVVLNNNESVIYNDVNIEKWGVFENYFKAGNYLQTTDNESFARVRYYNLTVEH